VINGPQVVHLQRVGGGLPSSLLSPNPDVIPTRVSMLLVRRHARRQSCATLPTMEHPSRTRELGPSESSTGRARAGGETSSGNEGAGSPGPDAAGAGRIHHCMRLLASPSAPSHVVRNGAVSRISTARCSPTRDGPGLGGRLDGRDVRGAVMTLQRRGRWTRRRPAARARSPCQILGAGVLYNVIDRASRRTGRGFSTDLPLETVSRRARARIYDGPDEVHKVTVAARS